MSFSATACPKCRAELPRRPEMSGYLRCPGCRQDLEYTFFPALDREPPKGETGELLVVDGEASCFFHANKRAVVPCAACGRFLCALCDVDIEGRHFCAACFQKGVEVGKDQSLERKRIRYDKIASMLVALSFVFSCVMPLTAPMAIFVAVRYWNAPGSIVENTRMRLVISCVVAVVEFCASIAFIYFLIHTQKHPHA